MKAGHDHMERGGRGREPKRGKRSKREEGLSSLFIVGQAYLATAR